MGYRIFTFVKAVHRFLASESSGAYSILMVASVIKEGHKFYDIAFDLIDQGSLRSNHASDWIVYRRAGKDVFGSLVSPVDFPPSPQNLLLL